MKRLPLLGLLLSLTSCAHVSSHQVAQTTNGNGAVELRSTDASGYTLFSSAQTLNNIKISQTDKSQSVGVAGVNQQGATNMVEALKQINLILQNLAAGAAQGAK